MMTRPTIVIAYGEYGYRILQSLLSNSSERGLLKWNRSKEIDGKRTLRNLELIWLTKHGQNRQIEEKLINQKDQIYRDLFQQIKVVSISEGDINPLKKVVDDAQRRLTSPDQLIQAGDVSTKGLDVFFLASLHSDNDKLPALDAMMYPLIEHINRKNKHFVDQFESAPILNFIEILDYDSLSSETDEFTSGRHELKQSIEGWQDTRKIGSSRGFGRVYICDGMSQGTYRNIDLRRKEVVLFLEFLFFESVREGELSHLFESKADKSILASFGIRLGEQNVEALSQYAAANFSKGWVNYLAGKDVYGEVYNPSEIKTKSIIESVDIKAIASKVKLDDNVKKEIEEKIAAVKAGLANRAELDFDDVLENLENTFTNAESKAAQNIASLLADIRKKELSTFKHDLINAVSYDLNESRYPVPIGKLIDIIDNNITDIKREQERRIKEKNNQEKILNTASIKNTLGKFYNWYASFLRNRIDSKKLRYIWPPFSFILSMALMPTIMYMLFYIDSPIVSYTDVVAYNPILVFILLMLVFVTVLSTHGQKYLSKKLKLANDWFVNTIKGRLIHALNSVSHDDKLFGKLNNDMYNSLHGEILQSLYDVKQSLVKRRLEMRWLLQSLPDLKLKLEPNEAGYDGAVSTWDGSSIRYDIRSQSDLTKMQNRLPPESHKYADRIEGAPIFFADWRKRYDSVFLSPLYVISQLSSLYSKPFYEDVLTDKEGNNTDAVTQYLSYQSRYLSVGLDFLQQDGLYESIKYALLSKEFIGLSKVEDQILSHFDIDRAQILTLENPLRIYLLTVKIGINQKVLGHVE